MATTLADEHWMIICQSYQAIPSLPEPMPEPIGLSIGTFDGVHLGHQALFQLLRQKVSPKGSVAALTFTQHPSQFFNVHAPTRLLCTLEHKLELLKALGVNLVILIEFNAAFAQQPFDQFLKEIKQHLPFSYLALGQNACFGKDRQGKPEAVKALEPHLHFEVNYLDKMVWDDQPISSGRIRNALQQGKLTEVASLLGRPYSVLAPLVVASGSLTMDTTDLCLPPDGTYSIRMGALQGEAVVSGKMNAIRLNFSTDPQLPSGSRVEIIF